MTDERRRVLDLLAQGKITVDEADQLMRAIDARREEPAAGGPSPMPRWVRIQVQKPSKDGREGKEVNIRVPIAVVKGGMRLGAIIATFAGEKAAQRMKDRGIDLDLSKINGDFSKMNGAEFEAFMKSLADVNIELDDGKSQVRITCE
jgi:SHOCT-like protein